MSHCCESMRGAVESVCNLHTDRFDCPDALLNYSARFDEYGIIIHDGGGSVMEIYFCPWCGSKLPDSKRDRWFEELESLGYSPDDDENIPAAYFDARWYSKKEGT
jgi:hypothetical protein